MVAAVRPDAAERLGDFLVARAAAEHRSDIKTPVREEAEVHRAFNRETGARAVAAEGARDRRNAAKLIVALTVTPALRGFAQVIRREGSDLEPLTHDPDHFACRNDFVHPPAVRRAGIHIFNKADDDPGAGEVLKKRNDLILVDAALYNGVHLHVLETGLARRVNPFEDLRGREPDVVKLLEDFFVERVKRHREAVKPRLFQSLRFLREDRAVGRHRDIDLFPVRGSESREFRDQILNMLSEERLAAREADFPDTMLHRDPGDPVELLKVQQFLMRQIGVKLIPDLLRLTVAAAEVAVIGDRNTDIGQRPPEHVDPAAVFLPDTAIQRNRQGFERLTHDRNHAGVIG